MFPPGGGVPVQRVLSFARYLPAHFEQVHVLTPRNAVYPLYDPHLLRLVPPEVKVHRNFTPELPYELRRRLFRAVSREAGPRTAGVETPPGASTIKRLIAGILSPDAQVVWLPFAARSAEALIREHAITHILVSVPPFSLLKIVPRLRRRFPSLGIVADFRDEWLRYYIRSIDPLADEGKLAQARQIEREAVESCDLVTATTESTRNEIRGRYADLPDRRFVVVPNGFDPEEFRGFQARPHGTSSIVVTYLGTVYKVCSPKTYLDALDLLPDEIRGRFETRFVGRVVEDQVRLFENRKSSFRLMGFQPHHEAIRMLEESDCLLLIVDNDVSLAGKAFEYLATRKPVLAIAPRGSETWKFVEQTGCGWCAEPQDVAGIAAMLQSAAEATRQGASFTVDQAVVAAFERPTLAARLAAHILRTSQATC
jgi:glycosyltransferase involved in cell wall biosynthesis